MGEKKLVKIEKDLKKKYGEKLKEKKIMIDMEEKGEKL